ncbi:MAG: hypothetical protein JWQ64_2179 [Subtercola sp.]|nr:hypothetical protein [Subtercola sp.]
MRDRHASSFVPFRSADDNSAADSWCVLLNQNTAAKCVERADSHPNRLTPPQSGVGEEEHERFVLAAFGSQTVYLLVREVDPTFWRLAREVHSSGWICEHPPVGNGGVKNGCEHTVGA